MLCIILRQNGLDDDDIELGDRFASPADDLCDDDVIGNVTGNAQGSVADELDEQTTRQYKTECRDLEWDDSTLSY